MSKSNRTKYSRPLNEVTKATEYILHGCIPNQTLTMLYGPTGIGKTTSLMSLLPYIMGHTQTDELYCSTPYKIVIFTEDKEQIEKLLMAIDVRYAETTLLEQSFTSYDNACIDPGSAPAFCDRIFSELRADGFIKEHDRVLWIWDTFASNFSISENNNSEVSALLSCLQRKFEKQGPLWFIHHTPKHSKGALNASPRGANALLANTHASFQFCKLSSNDENTYLIQEKVRPTTDYHGLIFTNSRTNTLTLPDDDGVAVDEPVRIVEPFLITRDYWNEVQDSQQSKPVEPEAKKQAVRDCLSNLAILTELDRDRGANGKLGITALRDRLSKLTSVGKPLVREVLDECLKNGDIIRREESKSDLQFRQLLERGEDKLP